jgi:hypothetical protein
MKGSLTRRNLPIPIKKFCFKERPVLNGEWPVSATACERYGPGSGLLKVVRTNRRYPSVAVGPRRSRARREGDLSTIQQ